MSRARLVVLVNGLAGAGKTTVSRPLAAALGLPLLGKDAVKETIADILGVDSPDGRTQREWSRALGAASMEAIWTLLASAPHGAVVEANLLASTRSQVVAGLARAGIDPADTVEVWCDVPADLARRRFEERAPQRHAVHGPQTGLDTEWSQWSSEAKPLGLGRVVCVDTTVTVNIDALAHRLSR